MMTTSVTPIERIASATGVPCATRTSTWRSLEMISSGVCLFWRIVILLGSKAILQDGPLQRGRITVIGDNIGFWIGETVGSRLLVRFGPRPGLTPGRIKLGQYLFMRHGGRVVFLG